MQKMNSKIVVLLSLILWLMPVFSQELQFGSENVGAVTDGPYVFWDNDKAAVEYVLNGHRVFREMRLSEPGSYFFKLEGFEREFELSTQPFAVESEEYTGVQKIFAVSDVHGQYDKFVEILHNNNVIDADLNWTWGEGHLVIAGDVVDRGAQVTECLWLIHGLEKEAQLWNGKVHFLLGNHEVMLMRGDTRYVNEKYLTTSDVLNRSLHRFFAADSEFGRWFRSKNTVVKINGILFVHAGLHPLVVERNYSISQINSVVRDNLDVPENSIKFNSFLNFLFKDDGPFWYRGYFQDTKGTKQVKQQELWNILAHNQATHIVVGHTTQEFINPFFGDKVIPLDTGIKYGNKGEGLLWQNNVFYRAQADGTIEQLTFD